MTAQEIMSAFYAGQFNTADLAQTTLTGDTTLHMFTCSLQSIEAHERFMRGAGRVYMTPVSPKGRAYTDHEIRFPGEILGINNVWSDNILVEVGYDAADVGALSRNQVIVNYETTTI